MSRMHKVGEMEFLDNKKFKDVKNVESSGRQFAKYLGHKVNLSVKSIVYFRCLETKDLFPRNIGDDRIPLLSKCPPLVESCLLKSLH